MENKMNIQEKIKNWIKETLKIKDDFVLAHPKDIKNGDYSFFISSENPGEYFEKLNKNKIKEIDRIELVNKFINFYLSKDFFAESVKEILDKGEKIGENNLLKSQKILIEHTQPNPFKDFHIGHLMNNAIGESVFRITKSNGADSIAVSYHGDVGLHVAKTIWGKIQKPELSWGDAYTYGTKNFDDNKEEITAINIKISEKSDEKINKLYEEGRKFSLEYFESLYERLDSHFDHHFFESEAGKVGKEVVLKNVGKIFEKSDGAIIFRGENFKPETHTRVFINSDGIPTYEAKEVGLAKLKKEKYKYNESITITANEQDAFFDVTEVAIGEVFPELKGKLRHLSHGMLRLPTGKMSSRTGDIITAESLIDQVKEKILEKIEDREFSAEEKGEIAELVAIGAIKYSILRQAIGGDIIFDFEKSISFEGDSGPYLQYACVRANSVLGKVSKGTFEMPQSQKVPFDTWETTELERYLYRFPEVVERAGREYAPHYIVTHLTELASLFNSFYAKHRIIENDSPPARLASGDLPDKPSWRAGAVADGYKIALTSATAHILKSGLHLLGIKVPKRM
jgi:arginyl-tRNA synthetase